MPWGRKWGEEKQDRVQPKAQAGCAGMGPVSVALQTRAALPPPFGFGLKMSFALRSGLQLPQPLKNGPMPPRFLASLENPVHPRPCFCLGTAGGSLLVTLLQTVTEPSLPPPPPLLCSTISPFIYLTDWSLQAREAAAPSTNPDHACTLQAQTQPPWTLRRPVTTTLSDSGNQVANAGALADRCPGEPSAQQAPNAAPKFLTHPVEGGACLESGFLGLCDYLDRRTWQKDVAVSRFSFTKWVIRTVTRRQGSPSHLAGEPTYRGTASTHSRGQGPLGQWVFQP